jgi:hypothetical protein
MEDSPLNLFRRQNQKPVEIKGLDRIVYLETDTKTVDGNYRHQDYVVTIMNVSRHKTLKLHNFNSTKPVHELPAGSQIRLTSTYGRWHVLPDVSESESEVQSMLEKHPKDKNVECVRVGVVATVAEEEMVTTDRMNAVVNQELA